MADFANRNLSVLAYAQGFTQWHYRGSDTVSQPATVAETLAPGFFDRACDMMKPGDVMLISARDGAVILHVVEAKDERVVVELMCGTARAVR